MNVASVLAVSQHSGALYSQRGEGTHLRLLQALTATHCMINVTPRAVRSIWQTCTLSLSLMQIKLSEKNFRWDLNRDLTISLKMFFKTIFAWTICSRLWWFCYNNHLICSIERIIQPPISIILCNLLYCILFFHKFHLLSKKEEKSISQLFFCSNYARLSLNFNWLLWSHIYFFT